MCIVNTIKIILLLLPILDLSSGCSKEENEEAPYKTNYMIQLVSLPRELNENSGMIWYDSLIWTINDSGGGPYIYAVDTATGEITRRVRLAGAINTDWEEITQDESYIYIGDIGNNEGIRHDLRIYKIRKAQLVDTIVTPDIIQYQYADQTDFTPAIYNTPYDCEALISADDLLYLFTKNWTGSYTRIYRIPTKPGIYNASHLDQLKVDGQVTASVYTAVNHRLYLLGYKDYVPFISVIDDFIPGEIYAGSIKQYLFPEKFGIQTEGIALTYDGEILVSCEKGYASPALYKVTIGD
jgi:hypothetical protein